MPPTTPDRRDEFELAWARHAKHDAGSVMLPDPVQEIAARVRALRSGNAYTQELISNAWLGYSLAPFGHPSIPDFVSKLDRNELNRLLNQGNEALNRLNQQEKTLVWKVSVVDNVRFVSTNLGEAQDWINRLVTALAKAGNTELLSRSRQPLNLSSERLHQDELAEWLAGNDEPEAFEDW